MSDIEFAVPPAKTYGLNVVASIASRFSLEGLNFVDNQGLQDALDEQLTQFDSTDVPDMPIWETEAVRLAKRFDERLVHIIDTSLSPHVGPSLAKKARGVVVSHLVRLEEAESDPRSQERDIVSTADIATAFQIDDLFESPEEVVTRELEEWSLQAEHPVIPSALKELTSVETTRLLLEAAWTKLFGFDDIDANVYLTNQGEGYHLYWATASDALDYATPDQYPLETQLSFDIPHNAAHLLHLHRLGVGATDYLDRLPERAYFESVALLSEYMVTQLREDDAPYIEELAKIIGLPFSEMYDWVQEDRRYEFKLRTARYLGDVLMSRGSSYDETVAEVAHTIDIPLDQAGAEVSKYLPWLGLNAVYIKGFRRLLDAGIRSVQSAIEPRPGIVVKTWQEFKETHKV